MAKVAIAALTHASVHGDTVYSARLLQALPADGWRVSLATWFNKQTPIHVGAERGKIFARLRTKLDGNAHTFNLPKSKAALRDFLCPGLRFTNLPEGSELSKEIKVIELHFNPPRARAVSTSDLKKSAISALVHAKAHGDVGHMKALVDSLPGDAWSRGLRSWLYTYSPIRKDRKSGRWHQAKRSDPDYRPYDIDGATRATLYGSKLPSVANLPRDDSFAKWENDLKGLSHEELFEAFRSFSDSIVDRRLTDDPIAVRTIEAISNEWQQRRDDDDYFTWPSTDAPPGLARLGGIEAPELGVLAALGYRVGKVQGRTTELRRFILDYVFRGQLPPINDAAYMTQWDAPSSPYRLEKMANAIASFIRNSKRMGSRNSELAIEQWSDDLNYLYHRYYAGKFGFAWAEV